MLETILNFLQKQLANQLASRLSSNLPLVTLSNLTKLDGSPVTELDNTLVLTLLNVEKEAAAPTVGYGYSPSQIAPPLHLNLDILVSAACTRYPDALTLLSHALGFFQSTPYFTPETAADWPAGVARLSIELKSLSLQDMNNLWGMLGAKYQPSVVYKVRMLSVQESQPRRQTPDVSAPDVNLGRAS